MATTLTPVRTRIAPSPTGEDIHIGNLYTALINYITAKKNNGEFIIRIEDTDRTRFVQGATEKILSTLTQYGILYNEGPEIGGDYGPYVQSERLELYKKYALELIEKKKAYYCFCTKEHLEELKKSESTKRHWDVCVEKNNNSLISTGEPFVIRLLVPQNTNIIFNDLIRGEISINSDQFDDQVLLKSDGYPTYHLAVVIDDYLMKISHIIRAEEWISSTPKHVLLYQAFGWDLPIFVHVPILRNPDKSKLSKRKNPVWASWYLEEGYLPEAVLNYLALMGWGHPEGKEIFTLEELITVFDLKDIQVVGPVFDIAKLTWMNQQYIQNLSEEELMTKLLAFYSKKTLDTGLLTKLLPLLKTRMQTLKEFDELTPFFFTDPQYELRSDEEKEIARELATALSDIKEWNHGTLLEIMKVILAKYSIRMPVLYYILTGKEKGLPLPDSLEILGKSQTLKRLQQIIQ